jgi:hypothetical protein
LRDIDREDIFELLYLPSSDLHHKDEPHIALRLHEEELFPSPVSLHFMLRYENITEALCDFSRLAFISSDVKDSIELILNNPNLHDFIPSFVR